MCKLWLQIKHTPYKRDIIRSFNIKLRSSYNLLRCNVKHRYKKFTTVTVIAKLDVFNVCKLASLISPRVIHVIIYIQGVLAIKYPCAHARVYICTCIIFQFSKSNLLISNKTTDTRHKYKCNNELGRNGMQTRKN